MDFLQKIGGRKFWMALLSVGVATFIELKTERGLSTTMAGFLGSIVAAFSMANYAATAKHMSTKPGGRNDDGISNKVDQLIEITSAANSPEAINNIATLLGNISNGVGVLTNTTGQIGSAVVNLNKDIQVLKKQVGG